MHKFFLCKFDDVDMTYFKGGTCKFFALNKIK